LTLVTAPSPILCQSSRSEAQATAAATIRVVPDENFDDWVVRPGVGQEFGHYPTREAAEGVAQAIAQERDAELVVQLPGWKNQPNAFCKKPDRRIVPAMIRRNRATPCYTFMPSTCSRVHASS
jgi:Uncharacterized protein conserved in bacteria (DUF2188)